MQGMELCENITDYQLVHALQKEYQLGMKKFPNDHVLRLGYICFLMDIMKLRQHCLQEIAIVEKNATSLDY